MLTARAATPAPGPAPSARGAPNRGTPTRGAPAGRQRESVAEAFAKSAVRAVGSSVGRQIVRGILGAMLKGR
jgi:hypothetical protein